MTTMIIGGFYFKPTEGGYVFRAPNAWGVMPAKHYFVNEVQKDQIKDLKLPGGLLAVVWLVSIALFYGGSFLFVSLYYGNKYWYESENNLGILMFLAFVVSFIVGVLLPLPLIRLWQLHRLEPLLSGARPTTERISRQERLEARSVRDYVRMCMWNGLAFGCWMFIAGTKLGTLGTPHGSYSGFALFCLAGIIFGVNTINNGRQAVRMASKYNSSSPHP
ncbi:MAG: hypothetical protein ACLPTZ_01665 [Beijerinckiaceae bacterium]